MVMGVKNAARTVHPSHCARDEEPKPKHFPHSCTTVPTEYCKPFDWQTKSMAFDITLMTESEVQARVKDVVESFVGIGNDLPAKTKDDTLAVDRKEILNMIHGIMCDNENYVDATFVEKDLLEDSKRFADLMLTQCRLIAASLPAQDLRFQKDIPHALDTRQLPSTRDFVDRRLLRFWPIVKTIK